MPVCQHLIVLVNGGKIEQITILTKGAKCLNRKNKVAQERPGFVGVI